MRYYVTDGRTPLDESAHQIRFEQHEGRLVAHVTRAGEATPTVHEVDPSSRGEGWLHVRIDDRGYDLHVEPTGRGGYLVQTGTRTVELEVVDEREIVARSIHGARSAGSGAVTASMPGIVVRVEVAEGETVEAGQTLLVLEAMKMQSPIPAPGPGTVTQLHVEPGQAVAAGDALLTLG